MIRATISSLLSPAELSHRILLVYSSPVFLTQYRGRRRTTTPPRWVPPVYEKNREHMLDEENRFFVLLFNKSCLIFSSLFLYLIFLKYSNLS
uniref:Ovule protein n=1 Tax=Heterorhabditis bacteriophora TaxID=37862 RepID=A0A1I7XH03_HETBA